MALSKVAVDAAAKKYWESFYKEYGRAWVRDIPRRVKTAMAETRRIASVDVESGQVFPTAATLVGDVATIEGLIKTSGADHMFQASFNGDGDIIAFDTVKLAAE